MTVALESIKDLVSRSQTLQNKLKTLSFSPDSIKTLNKRYNITEAAQLVGRTAQAIRDAEVRGNLPEPLKHPKTKRRSGYSLEALNHMRNKFGTTPRRNPAEDEPCILSIQNFKGGVGKSTISAHVAQYLARAGYRVLLIDCDSQASTTLMFGYAPDQDLDEEDTLLPYFRGEKKNIKYAIRDTYWDSLKLIPSNLWLYGSEYSLAASARSGNGGKRFYHWLRDGIMAVKHDFDIVIIDPPPALGMISLNVLYAANAVIVPMPPGMLDFASSIQFLTMVEEVLETINEELDYSFIKILISRKKQRSQDGKVTTQDEVVELARDHYGKYMMSSIFYDSAEIEAAVSQSKTVFELEGPCSNYKTYKRALATLELVGEEIETMIRLTWPSHRRQMAKEGIM